MTDRFLDNVDAFLDAVEASESHRFSALVACGGLDPGKDLVFGEFSDCTFDGDDLRHFDLTGCNLRGASFTEAFIAGAVLDLADVSLTALSEAADFDVWLKGDLKRLANARRKINPSRLPDLARFREAPWAPEMVVIPAGEFWMGSDDDDKEAFDEEKPKRKTRIPRRFALGRYPVTFEEYDLFCDATGRKRPDDRSWRRERRPVINVNWRDANAYAAWPTRASGSRRTGCRARRNLNMPTAPVRRRAIGGTTSGTPRAPTAPIRSRAAARRRSAPIRRTISGCTTRPAMYGNGAPTNGRKTLRNCPRTGGPTARSFAGVENNKK